LSALLIKQEELLSTQELNQLSLVVREKRKVPQYFDLKWLTCDLSINKNKYNYKNDKFLKKENLKN